VEAGGLGFDFLGVPPIFFPPFEDLLKGVVAIPSLGFRTTSKASSRETNSGMMKVLLILFVSKPGRADSEDRAARVASMSSAYSVGTGPKIVYCLVI
jgi:hypothetical protein